jgi:hypothetical protein
MGRLGSEIKPWLTPEQIEELGRSDELFLRAVARSAGRGVSFGRAGHTERVLEWLELKRAGELPEKYGGKS